MSFYVERFVSRGLGCEVLFVFTLFPNHVFEQRVLVRILIFAVWMCLGLLVLCLWFVLGLGELFLLGGWFCTDLYDVLCCLV